MQLPNAVNSVVSENKVVGYLMNAEHKDGAPKAQFFEMLGFRVDEWQVLASALRQLAIDSPVAERVESSHGVKYIVDGRLSTPSGKSPLMRTVWIVDRESDVSRLVTAYPR